MATRTARQENKIHALPSKVSLKNLRKDFSNYLAQVRNMRRSLEIMADGQTILMMSHPSDAPQWVTPVKEYPIERYLHGLKGKISSAAYKGPYAIVDGTERVAIIYPPNPNLSQKVSNLVTALDEIGIIKEDNVRLMRLRATIDQEIRNRIKMLRESNQGDLAEKMEKEWKDLDAQRRAAG